MKRWLIVLAACGSTPAPAPQPPPPTPPPPPPSLAAIAGGWSGMGYQPDVQAPVEVQLTIAPAAAFGAHVGTIAYPRSPCTAELTRLEAPSELRARERMTTNPDDACVDGGTIILPLAPNADDMLELKWLFPDGTLGVTATLAR